MKTRLVFLIAALLVLLGHAPPTFAQGTAFTYQGRLTDNGAPATGIYDLRFAIYDLDSGGSAADVSSYTPPKTLHLYLRP